MLFTTLIRFCARASAASARGRFRSGASVASCSLARSSALSARATSILQVLYGYYYGFGSKVHPFLVASAIYSNLL